MMTTAYKEYIYGSAEVVGLMCLYVFCEKDLKNMKGLKPYAQSLGAAFQKVNFLRDVKADYQQLERTYFPEVDFRNFTAEIKKNIEKEIMEILQMHIKELQNCRSKQGLVCMLHINIICLFLKK